MTSPHLGQPLADLMRPTGLEQIVGQNHLVGSNGVLQRMVATKHILSHILWGPTGSGKTSIARLLAAAVGYAYVPLSAASSGIGDLRKALKEVHRLRELGTPSLVFIDECHRWSKSQQDAILPLVEDGTITLIAATTENPSYEVNRALLSRCRVYRLHSLNDYALEEILQRTEVCLGKSLPLQLDARIMLRNMADGDGRYLLNLIEDLLLVPPDSPINADALGETLSRHMPAYDKGGRLHQALISALQKSIRGSDTNAALYWLSRLLIVGVPLEIIARRLLAIALEDIGMADTQALLQAIAAKDAVEFLGPLGETALAQCTIYLCTAPKSNKLSLALSLAKEKALQTSNLSPLYTPTDNTRYHNDHNFPNAFAGQPHLPVELAKCIFYQPVERGFEREVIRRLSYWDRLRKQRMTNEGNK